MMTKYKGITYDENNGRFMIVSNKDLLDLGMCTPKTLQRGHKGYVNLSTLKRKIDKIK